MKRALALGALVALLAAPPAFADYYNTNPTPAERAATERLNSDAAVRARGDAGPDFGAGRNVAPSGPDRAFGDARRWDAFYGKARFRDIAALPARELIGLRVSTRGGGRIGVVRDVDTNRYGRVTRVAIGVAGGNLAWVDADDLRFDPTARVIYTTLSRGEVDSMARMRYPRF
ncbi:MAG TPA: hypothetical protein VGC36_16805 [Rhizomicrobium sp.]